MSGRTLSAFASRRLRDARADAARRQAGGATLPVAA
jgi:hypothetical protein